MKPLHPICASLLLLSACASRGPEALLRDREAHEPTRLAAVAQVSNPDLLWRTMANARDALTMRQAAASRLWSLDGDAFWKRMEKDYAQVNQGLLWDWLCKEAGKAKEWRALRAMVLSLGKGEPMANDFHLEFQRPACNAICEITGVPEVVFPLQVILAGLDGRLAGKTHFKDDPASQQAAYLLFSRGTGGMPKTPVFPAHPSLTFIENMAPRLAVHPMVDEEIEILHTQSALPQRPNQPKVAPRGLPLARRDLLAPAFTPLSPPVPRTKDAPLLSQAQPSAADTAVCAELVRALHDQALVATLFADADADLADKRSEHGGLLYWNGQNEVVFEAVPASFRRHDEIYLPPESLFEKLRDGLAHVHFHAQKQDNGEYAGPGKGDLEFVERNRVNAVVFTFVDKDTLNADAYFPGKIVVDLGCIKRRK